MFLLSFGGCGYNAAPYYEEDSSYSDANVNITLKEPTAVDNNSSESNITNINEKVEIIEDK